ncbi:hypothetical protein HDU93_003157, partial [Gonapodya sp. JEL0774]
MPEDSPHRSASRTFSPVSEHVGPVPSSVAFYEPFHGHNVEHLAAILHELRKPVLAAVGSDGDVAANHITSRRNAIFLMGDSSMDNKYWLADSDQRSPVGNYPLPWMKPDIAYAINAQLEARGLSKTWFCINTAVEATCLSDRHGSLLSQDEFVVTHLEPGDVIVASIGANDIALRPTLLTGLSMLTLTWTIPRFWLERVADAALPAPSWWALPPGLGHFVHLFKNRVSSYLNRIVRINRPRAILVCAIYYPCMSAASPSWADRALSALGYDSDPLKLQAAIRCIYRLATSGVKVNGVDEVVPVALFD